MTFDRFDQFEAYTENALPPDQRQRLEQQLATDATLRAELDAYQQFRYSIEAVQLKRQLEQVHTRLDRAGELSDRPPILAAPRLRRSRVQRVILFLCVLMGVGLGLYWLNRPTVAQQTFLAYYQPEPVARGLNDCGPETATGIRAYRAKNYRQALTDFEQLPASQPCVLYYRGISFLALDDASKAIVALENAVAQPGIAPDLTHQKAEWYLALAYLKANQPDSARPMLRTITQQTGHPFQNVARRALADLTHD